MKITKAAEKVMDVAMILLVVIEMKMVLMLETLMVNIVMSIELVFCYDVDSLRAGVVVNSD